jgi:hypothetical protein
VRALETTNRFKGISRPSVFNTNNKAALIASGSQVPVPASTTSGFTVSSSDLVTTSAISYENVLLQLSIIPVINAGSGRVQSRSGCGPGQAAQGRSTVAYSSCASLKAMGWSPADIESLAAA